MIFLLKEAECNSNQKSKVLRKLSELGFLQPDRPYRFLCVLTKECMFRVQQRDSRGKIKKKACKPLQLIWTKFPQWNKRNSVHLDDLATNFCLNPRNGLKCTAFYRTKSNAQADCELLLWAKYLELLAGDADVTTRDHKDWMKILQSEAEKNSSRQDELPEQYDNSQ